jgi:hypothetical protein
MVAGLYCLMRWQQEHCCRSLLPYEVAAGTLLQVSIALWGGSRNMVAGLYCLMRWQQEHKFLHGLFASTVSYYVFLYSHEKIPYMFRKHLRYIFLTQWLARNARACNCLSPRTLNPLLVCAVTPWRRSWTTIWEIMPYHAWFEVLKTVVMKSTIFWDLTSCSPLKVNRRFGGTYRLHLHRVE